LIGTTLQGRYEVLEEVGTGPVFDSFRAKDQAMGREVAIRIFREPFDAEPDFVSAVRTTVDRYSGILGTGIESMIDMGNHEGTPFLVTEYTPGQSLRSRVEKLAPFSVSVAVSTAISICEGLNSLHHAGVAHGDLSAHNIAVQPDGRCRLQLAGLWEAYSASKTAGLAVLPGMAPYLAPEVSAGGMPSPSSDVYAVGIWLYQLLSGRFPYSADTPVAMALKHASSGVPSVKIYNNAVPAVLDEIVKKAMAKEPANRYSSASDLLADLRILQDGLRFGRTLNWPLRSASPAAAGKLPVAPKMGAIRDADAAPEKERVVRDVPMWLIAVFGVFGALFLVLIGVWVVFNVSQPRLVVVPNIKGAKLAEATKTLEALKLKVQISGRETNDVQPPDTVLSMSPIAGSKRHEGATVYVKISTGSRYVTVPDLQGTTLDKARTMLQAVNLTLSDNYTMQPHPKFQPGTIIAQSPDPKTKVDRFGRVTVVVSSGTTGSIVGGPDADKQFLYNLKIKLTGLTERVILRVDISDARGERPIYESPHEPEDTVEIPVPGFGKKATFKIYYDNQLVTTKEQVAEEEVKNPE